MASTSSTTTREIKRMLTLRTIDNEKFYLEESFAFQSELIKNMVKEEGVSIIPLPIIVKRRALIAIIEYLKKHAELTTSDEEFKIFKKEHLNGTLYDLCYILISADYLKINNLKEILLCTIGDKIRGKSVDTIREMFKINDDLTHEEIIEKMKKEGWAGLHD